MLFAVVALIVVAGAVAGTPAGLNGICRYLTNMTFCLTGDAWTVTITPDVESASGSCPPTGI
jgi:hypothetical protein